jgi:hypothetical protein
MPHVEELNGINQDKQPKKNVIVIFDRVTLARCSDGRPGNEPDKLVARREASLRMLGEFCGADKVEYVDYGKSERYFITKDKKTLELFIAGNSFEGGFMNIAVQEKDTGMEGRMFRARESAAEYPTAEHPLGTKGTDE